MRNKKLGTMLLCSFSLAAILGGCGSSSKEGAGTPADVAKVDEAKCAQCHAKEVSKVTGDEIYADYIASAHFTVPGARASYPDGVGCQGCHGGGAQHYGEGPLPYPDPAAAGKCFECHKPAFLGKYGGAPNTNHYYTMTDSTGVQSAMYVSKNYENACTACHDPHKAENGILPEHRDWAESGHGDVNGLGFADRDFKTYGANCTPCHTSTGFINYVKAGFVMPTVTWATAGDASREVVTCQVCHTDFNFGKRVRGIPAVTAMYKYAGNAIVFPNSGASNLCITCHSGRGNTESAPSSRFQGHHAGAAGILFSAKAHLGYEYAGKSYADSPVFIHDQLGTSAVPNSGENGPCVTCHMQTNAKSHSFEIVTKNSTGAITAVNSTDCATCHGAISAGDLEALRKGYNDAGALLTNYVGNKTGTTNYLGAAILTAAADDKKPTYYANVAKEAYGAFQNSKLTTEEKGAYAHNSLYAKRLIFDSIDWMDNGALDGTITVPAGYPDAREWLDADGTGAATRP